jgi:hypothetical protein
VGVAVMAAPLAYPLTSSIVEEEGNLNHIREVFYLLNWLIKRVDWKKKCIGGFEFG